MKINIIIIHAKKGPLTIKDVNIILILMLNMYILFLSS